jgi:hypothetical protein
MPKLTVGGGPSNGPAAAAEPVEAPAVEAPAAEPAQEAVPAQDRAPAKPALPRPRGSAAAAAE